MQQQKGRNDYLEKTLFGKNISLHWSESIVQHWPEAEQIWQLLALGPATYSALPLAAIWPLVRQFWAINWQRIRERTLQSHRLPHHFQFASWRGQQDGLNSSSCVYLGYSLTPSHHISAALCHLTITISAEIVSLLNSFCWGIFLLLQQAWRHQKKALSGWPVLSAHHLGVPHPKEDESQHRRGRGTA